MIYGFTIYNFIVSSQRDFSKIFFCFCSKKIKEKKEISVAKLVSFISYPVSLSYI